MDYLRSTEQADIQTTNNVVNEAWSVLDKVYEEYNDNAVVKNKDWFEKSLSQLNAKRNNINSLLKTWMNRKDIDNIKNYLYKNLNDITSNITEFTQNFEPEPEVESEQLQGGANKRLEKLTVKELQQRCIKRKIAYSGKRKAELIAALRRKK